MPKIIFVKGKWLRHAYGTLDKNRIAKAILYFRHNNVPAEQGRKKKGENQMFNLKNELTSLENKVKEAQRERRKAENKGDTAAIFYNQGLETAYESMSERLRQYIKEIPFDL